MDTLKSMGDFVDDLLLALCFQDRKPENKEVREVIGLFFFTNWGLSILDHMAKLTKTLSLKELQAGISEASKRIKDSIKARKKLTGEELAVLISCFYEWQHRIKKANPDKVSFASGVALATLLYCEQKGTLGGIKELIRKATGIHPEQALLGLCEEDITKIANQVKGADPADRIKIGEVFYEEFLKTINKHFGNLSDNKVIEQVAVYNPDFSYIPHRVWQKSVRKVSKEKIKGEKIPVVYIPSPVEEIVAYREQIKPVIKVLLEEKDRLATQAKTQRLVIDIIIEELQTGNFDISPSVLANKTKIPLGTAKKTLNRLKKRVPVLANLIS